MGLLDRVALNDHAAFDELYARTSKHLYGVAIRLVRKREAAQEILQDAFISVWQQAGSYAAPRSSPMTWLMFIVRNKALDHLRKARRAPWHEPGPAETGEPAGMAEPPAEVEHIGPETLLAAANQKMLINLCMARLDARQRQSLALTYYSGLSHAELAQHLQVPLGTAKAWVRRGLCALGKCVAAPPPRISPAS